MLIYPSYSAAQLDQTREANFQRAFNRYSNNNSAPRANTSSKQNRTNPNPNPSTTEQVSTPPANSFSSQQESTELEVVNNTLVVDTELFAIGFSNNSDLKFRISSNTFYNFQEELLSFGVYLGNDHISEADDYNQDTLNSFLFHSSSYNKDIAPGSMLIVRSRFQSTTGTDFENTTLSINREQINPELTYHIFGEISLTSTGRDFNQNRVAVLTTIDFNPCFIEVGIARIVEERISSLREVTTDKQKQIDLAAQCIIAQNLEGKVFASIALIDSEGRHVEKIDLNGELTLEVATSLFLRYSFARNGSESLVSSYTPSFKGDELTEDNRIEADSLFIRNARDLPGTTNTVTFEYRTDEEEECINKRSLTLGTYEGAEQAQEKETKPLFLAQYSNSCDPSREEEINDDDSFESQDFNDTGEIELKTVKTTELSFGNTFYTNNNPTTLFNFNSESSSPFKRLSYSFTYLDVADQENGDYNLYEGMFSTAGINNKGLTSDISFRITHQRNETVLTFSQEFTAPITSLKNQLSFQRPFISEADKANALNTLNISERELRAALFYAYSSYDLGLCNTVDCYTLSYSVSVSDNGGLYMNFEWKTIFDISNSEFEVYLEAGLPLRSTDENSLIDFSYLEVGATSYQCSNTKEFCTTLKARREEQSTTAGFLVEYEF